MKYIVFKKLDNKVIDIRDKEPIAYTNNLSVARCEYIPIGKTFKVINIREKQEEYIDRVTETVTITTGEEKEIIRAITKVRTYLVCDLIGE